MIEPTIPDDEERRLALLRACNIIYTPAEEAFDDMARLAAEICGTDIALITLVDADYQWFKARVGVEHVGVPRDLSFCGHCINHRHALVVEDTLQDPRFADNPLVTSDPNIRFYAGVPLLIGEGSSIGALSVAHRTPRTLGAKELAALERLAKQIAREISLRRDLDRAEAKVAAANAGDGSPLAIGATVGGRWTIAREIGRGAAGVVFEAHDASGERVAIKVLLPEWTKNEQVVERFAREARVLMQLKTPYVGKLIDVGNLSVAQGSLPYLALEYLEGTDLGRLLEEKGSIPYRDALTWCADACDGLGEAHDLGVVHRDLKPSNIFLASTAQESPTVKVLDFGIAAAPDPAATTSRLTNMGAVVGTPVYMAPEQMMSPSDVDARSDVWSMGTVLYELVTGALPWQGDSDLQLFANIMTKPPAPPRAHDGTPIPPPIESLVMRCLSRQPEERYASMPELATALRAAVDAR